MGFATQSIADRLDRMGDEAEGMFRLWAKERRLTVEAFGFEGRELYFRPGMDPRLRKRPDFLCWSPQVPHTFVDPKGTAGSGVKINCADIDHKAFWQQMHPVWFFIYDSSGAQISFVALDTLKKLAEDAPVGHFEDGGKRNPYYEIAPDRLTWQRAPTIPGLASWS